MNDIDKHEPEVLRGSVEFKFFLDKSDIGTRRSLSSDQDLFTVNEFWGRCNRCSSFRHLSDGWEFSPTSIKMPRFSLEHWSHPEEVEVKIKKHHFN